MRRDGSGAVEGRRSDMVRAVALLAAVVLQAVAGAIGGSGAWGEPVGSVANSYPTLILPGGGAFSIWTLIYVLSIVLAVRAALPRQRRREVHRGVGWWLVAAGVLNAAWVVAFTQRWLVLAEAIIVALLVVLCTAWVKVTGHPAGGWADRLLLHTPIGVYVGWVGVATVSGAASTGVALGITPPPSVSVPLAVLAVLGTAVAAVVAVVWFFAVLGFAAAVAWALAWIAVATPSWPVAAAAIVGVLSVVSAAVLSFWRSRDRVRAAWG